MSPEYALPATVAAAHLTASAAELAKDAAAVGDLADLTAVMDQLVAGQQHIAVALGKLADHIAGRHRDGSLAAVDAPEIAALTEVLAAAAAASGHAAGALEQSRPVLDIVLAAAGPDARI
ncbi:MAG TPA: hypothetical protein VHF06_13075 [Pseudonocardiaceae bacterium]|nr:hypothetical protein [Pseudonocardiaceae bacterium]